MIRNTLVLILAATLFACTSKEKDLYVPAAETRKEATAAAELRRDVVVTVDYRRGQEGLSAQAHREIKEALLNARKMGEISSVDIAVWSDQAYPDSGKKLSAIQVRLAAARARNIEILINATEPKANVEVYNMAQQPNAFEKWVNTRDADVKAKLTNAGVTSRTVANETIYKRTAKAMIFIGAK